MDESQLVEAARTDPDAFAALYDRTAAALYRFTYSLVRDHARAEDTVSETYRRALDRLPSYTDRGQPFQAWLFTIARHLVIDSSRKSGREVPLLEIDVPNEGWVGAGLVVAEDRIALKRALGRLNDDQRAVVVLRFGREWPCRRVATELGKTEAAVKQMTHRAVQRLRQLLEEDGYVRDARE